MMDSTFGIVLSITSAGNRSVRYASTSGGLSIFEQKTISSQSCGWERLNSGSSTDSRSLSAR